MLASFAVAALCAGLVASSPLRVRSPYVVKESHFLPSKWERVGPAPADHVVNLQIGLKQSQFDELERHLHEVSDPDHGRYGQHLSVSEVNDLTKPSDDTWDLVHDWLLGNGIHPSRLQYNPAKDWISVSLPINAVESLLDTKYSVFGHEDGDYLVRTPEWSLPQHLHKHIDVVQPTNSFFRPQKLGRMLKTVEEISEKQWHPLPSPSPPKYTPGGDAVSVCNTSAVTPLCLRTLYGTVDYVPQVPGKNKVGLTDYLAESNNRSDTALFLEQYRPEAVSAAKDFKVVVIADGNDEQTQETPEELAAGKDLEGNLDVETIIGIGWPTPLIAYTTGGSPPFTPDLTTPSNTNEPYLEWVNYVLGQDDLPQSISTSYADSEQTVPYSYAKSVCGSFAKLGARGISLFFGSGDNGVGRSGDCLTNDGKNTSTFLALFPTSCPYITSVGATKFIPEVVATDARNGFVSGGGFSRYFPRPSYQDHIVPRYVESLGDQFKGLYNKEGRGYPDLAAQGYHYVTVWNGTIVSLDGTSASTPTIAAIISLVNDALIADGKPPLGFLNPWLYKRGYRAFTDVTSGSASGCNSTGFPAQEGWDAVTGFGTPYFPKILDILDVEPKKGHHGS
ncbi:Tripeptidyl peptidase [Venustampulla echinocandica]|uniref:tripeptidyl-peptidase II n=1 Tax=Venustampulla echinocandica TaxID=2656787 RepID=A0A370TSX3_9HELO|nr:Tripeptidyl peptidase [Venustampulla echinocandica]RDL38636.1 Tripeptidyl peptidase [Venustampulla echinocandica]